MSKIGKKSTLQSKQSQLVNQFRNNTVGINGVRVSGVREVFNSVSKRYEGVIEFTGINKFIKQAYDALIKNNFFDSIQESLFNVETHYEELKELKTATNLGDGLNVYKFKSPLEYNFLIKNYENYLKQTPTIQEINLPYFYDLLFEYIQENTYKGFNGTEFFETPEKIISSGNGLKTIVFPSNITVDKETLSINTFLERYNGFKEQFPFYTDISFDTHEVASDSLTNLFNKYNLTNELLTNIISNSTQGELVLSGSNVSIATRVYDLEKFLNDKAINSVNNNFTFIFDLNQAVENKSRTFLEIFNRKKEYSEVFAYHLKKYDGRGTTLLQEWYIPNTSQERLSFIDSQIKYNKEYTYKIDLVILTFSSECRIFNPSLANDTLSVSFYNTPRIKAYTLGNVAVGINTTLGATYTNRLLDSPPIEPEIEVIPYIGIENKIKLNINSSIGRKTVPAITFNDEEKNQNLSLRESQNLDIETDLLTFESDDPPDFFEIYRIDFKPTSYNDFFNNKLRVLSTANAASAAYVDTITPNKKYYYVVRTLDFHGNVSNPTPIYEVEIVNDNGFILPVINVYDILTNEKVNETFKSFKRYLKIQPAARHRVVDLKKTNSSDISLGTEEKNPWGKRFKMRLTSKSSGKKIDINFVFKYNKPS